MADTFILTIYYNGEEQEFKAELRLMGYTHKIAVNIEDTEVLFEPDEERNYRALISEADMHKKKIDTELVRLIAMELEANLK